LLPVMNMLPEAGSLFHLVWCYCVLWSVEVQQVLLCAGTLGMVPWLLAAASQRWGGWGGGPLQMKTCWRPLQMHVHMIVGAAPWWTMALPVRLLVGHLRVILMEMVARYVSHVLGSGVPAFRNH
jgi:hypothetical protein